MCHQFRPSSTSITGLGLILSMFLLARSWKSLPNDVSCGEFTVLIHSCSAYDVIRLKGYTNWAIGLSVASLTRCILRDQRDVVAMSTLVKVRQTHIFLGHMLLAPRLDFCNTSNFRTVPIFRWKTSSLKISTYHSIFNEGGKNGAHLGIKVLKFTQIFYSLESGKLENIIQSYQTELCDFTVFFVILTDTLVFYFQ